MPASTVDPFGTVAEFCREFGSAVDFGRVGRSKLCNARNSDAGMKSVGKLRVKSTVEGKDYCHIHGLKLRNMRLALRPASAQFHLEWMKITLAVLAETFGKRGASSLELEREESMEVAGPIDAAKEDSVQFLGPKLKVKSSNFGAGTPSSRCWQSCGTHRDMVVRDEGIFSFPRNFSIFCMSGRPYVGEREEKKVMTRLPDTAKMELKKFLKFQIRILMVAKKEDALEERLEGEMSQIKATVEDRISSVESKVFDLHTMMKKILENQIAASKAKEPMGKTTSSVYHRRDDEVKIIEEQGDRYEGRHGCSIEIFHGCSFNNCEKRTGKR
ncbi:hypothetical protein M5K25_021346 [Dendrobium thyrsiflorum]|uniref:Uncharacterized protein n=1 Tax=Dendrobium thyrsiflorum TaxID=117978 RepID=A0ABD0UCZ4_DENTH